MSAISERDIVRRDRNGVLLFYADPSVRRLHHIEQKVRPGDRLRCAVVRAQRELFYMTVMIECLEGALSHVALEKFEYSLRTIETTLNMARAELGLSVADDGNIHGE